MKIFSKFAVFLMLFVAVSGIYSQNLGKVKATISDMPNQMQAGSSTTVTVTITNIGKNKWTNENIYSHELGAFEIKKDWTGTWELEPGQSKDLQYSVTAPNTSGSYKMRIVIYNGDKKIGYRSKKVEVISLTGK